MGRAAKPRPFDNNQPCVVRRTLNTSWLEQGGCEYTMGKEYRRKIKGYKAPGEVQRKDITDEDLEIKPTRVIGSRLSLSDVAPEIPAELAKARKENAAAEAAEDLA